MTSPSPLARLAKLLLPLLVGAAALVWALLPKSSGPKAAARPSPIEATGVAAKPSRAQALIEIARGSGPEANQRLADAYGALSADPNAVAERRLILKTLLDNPDLPTKLSSVLAAVQADPTPPTRDPLWADVVNGLSNQWRGDAITHAADLMFAETRPRAKQALISSLAELATDHGGELLPPQKQAISNYFIDMYGQVEPWQKPELVATVRRLSGNDAADVLLGKGLHADGELEGQRSYNAALQGASAAN